MYKEIQELSQTRRATNDAYAALLELSIYGEAVSIWDKEDFATNDGYDKFSTIHFSFPYTSLASSFNWFL